VRPGGKLENAKTKYPARARLCRFFAPLICVRHQSSVLRLYSCSSKLRSRWLHLQAKTYRSDSCVSVRKAYNSTHWFSSRAILAIWE